MAKKAKKKATADSIKSLAELRETMNLGTPRTIHSVPFRSDVLNLFTGGGVKFGHVTEVSGPPSMFKSTMLAEIAIAGLEMGAHVIVHDKERKLTESRFVSLGCHKANKRNPKFWYREDNWPEYVLSLEKMFEDVHTIYASVRMDDLETLKALFESGKATKEVCERYAHVVKDKMPKISDKKNKTWQKKVSGALFAPSQLEDEERTPIIWIVDSVTAIPNREEAIGDDGQPNLTPNIAKNARVWSDLFRVCGFMDSKVAALHIAQMRTAGIGHGQQAYKKAAVPAANEFYATNRIKIFPRENGVLYRDPNDPQNIFIGKQAGNKDDKAYQIGRIIMAAIDKNLEGISTAVPIYMLSSTGTDVINSLFEFLNMRNLIVNRGRYYSWDDKFWPERAGETFERASFTNIYLEQGRELYARLYAWKEIIKNGAGQESKDAAEPEQAAGPR